jgi:hypothetical protein
VTTTDEASVNRQVSDHLDEAPVPTRLIERGYRFGIVSADCSEPPHVHVVGNDGSAKFWLDPLELAQSEGYNAHRIRQMASIIRMHQGNFTRKWHEACYQIQ